MTLTTIFWFFDEKFLSPNLSWIICITLIALIIGIILVWVNYNDNKKTGLRFSSLKNEIGYVLGKDNHFYLIKIAGEIWKAHSQDNLNIGDEVYVEDESSEHLLIQVKKRSSL